jgi:hypothetical protein
MKLFLFLALVSCDPPDPLPPSVNPEPSRNSRMISAGQVKGYSVDGYEGRAGTLVVVDRITTDTRKRVRTLSTGPILVIPGSINIGKARAYFEGLDTVDTVRIICEMKDCPDGLNPKK